jgi:AraC-like DNA-binding protein
MSAASLEPLKPDTRLTLGFVACGGVELQHGRSVAHQFTPHFHDEYQVLVMLDGALRLQVNGAEYDVAPPTICAVNPGEVHAGRSDSWGWECRNFYVPAEFAARVGGVIPRFAAPLIEDPALADAMAAAHKLASADAGSLKADSALVNALGMLFCTYASRETASSEPASRACVRRAESYLREHFAATVRLEMLAALAGLSPFHFLRVFARETGLPPHAYQTQLRLAFAKRRLADGAPAAIAATEAGFYDQSHLIRALRRSHGLTPAMIRRAAERNSVQ